MNRKISSKMQIGVLLVPGLLIFGIFTIYPIAKLFVMSFFKWDFGSSKLQGGFDRQILPDRFCKFHRVHFSDSPGADDPGPADRNAGKQHTQNADRIQGGLLSAGHYFLGDRLFGV